MPVRVRRFTAEDLPEVVALALRAWSPVFASMADVLGPAMYGHLYPDWAAAQARAVTACCTRYALEAIRQAGCRIAVVATGGDPGHAPARHVYERAGFRALPLVRYHQAL